MPVWDVAGIAAYTFVFDALESLAVLLVLFLAGALLFVVAVVIIWIVLYVCAVIGVAVYYIFKPMQVSKKPGTYGLDKVKEAGKREKGKS